MVQCYVHLVCNNKSIKFYAYFLNLTRVLWVQKRYKEYVSKIQSICLLDRYWKFKFIYFTYICIHLIFYIHIHMIFYIDTYIWYFTFGNFCMENSESASFSQLPCHNRFIICNIFSTYLQKGDVIIDGSRIVLRVSNDIFYSITSAQVFVTATNSYSISTRSWSVIDRASKYQPARISFVHDVHTTKCTLLVFQNMRTVFNDLIVIA